MERKDNRFAFRSSNELGDFIRKMAKQAGWDASEIIRFGLGYFMMHVKTGVFKAFGDSQYGQLLKKINITSRDLIPDGDIDGLLDLSEKYSKSMESAMVGMEPDEPDAGTHMPPKEPASVEPAPESPKPKKKPKSKSKKSRKRSAKGKKRGRGKTK